MKFKIAFGLLLLSMASAQASELTAAARSYVYSCGYFSKKDAQFELTYRGEFRGRPLPADAQVTVVYGFNGTCSQGPLEWENRNNSRAEPVEGQPGVFRTMITGTIVNRGSDAFFNSLAFFVNVRLPSGEWFDDKGGLSTWSYYKVTPGFFSDSPCVGDPNRPEPKFQAVPVTVVEKN